MTTTNKIIDLLKRAETEMRYAGWDIPNPENVAREPLYRAIEAEIGGKS